MAAACCVNDVNDITAPHVYFHLHNFAQSFSIDFFTIQDGIYLVEGQLRWSLDGRLQD